MTKESLFLYIVRFRSQHSVCLAHRRVSINICERGREGMNELYRVYTGPQSALNYDRYLVITILCLKHLTQLSEE